MKHTTALIACVLFAATLTAHAQAAPDLVVFNGSIHTQDENHRVVAAMAIRGHDIVALGTDEEIRALAGPATRALDLAGRVVLPGLIDAHVHPAESAQDMDKCNLGDRLLARAELLAAVAKCYREHPVKPPRWFEVVQVNPSGLTLTRGDLDPIAGKRPLLLEGSDGHTVWANSAALRAAHVTAHTPDPAGGHISHDRNGNPDGTLRDLAGSLVLEARPSAGMRNEVVQLHKALSAMRATGITSVQDASVDEHSMQLYRRLYDAKHLQMRVRGSYLLSNLAEPAQTLIHKARAFRSRWAIDPDMLRADAVKIFADGVIEFPSQTAALLEPYLDASGKPTTNRGPSYFEQDNLNRIVAAADAADFTVHIHAIGDRAVRGALDAFAYSRKLQHATDNRDQIAHLELIDPSDFPRFAALNVIANFQLQWATSDPYITTATLPYLGAERGKHLYPAGALSKAGARIAGGSDWGVSTFNPFEAIEHAITRAAGPSDAPLLPGESLPLETAVDAYTINAAYALRQERTTGSLAPGKRADFIVLDRDLYALDPFQIHTTRVLQTYLDGERVYEALPAP